VAKVEAAMKRKEKTEMQKEMPQRRILTKRRQWASNYRMSIAERNLMVAACAAAGESRSEFLRRSVHERALRILAGDRLAAANQ